MGNLSKHFSTHEVTCRCGCGFNGIDYVLLYGLEELRKQFNDKPIYLNSVCRCKAHNEAQGGASRSQHIQGRAADIKERSVLRVSGGPHNNLLAMAALARDIELPYELQKLLGRKRVFTGIGFYDWGIHVDVRPGGRLITWGKYTAEFDKRYGAPSDFVTADEQADPEAVIR